MKGSIINNRKWGVEVWLASALLERMQFSASEVCGKGMEKPHKCSKVGPCRDIQLTV